MQKRLQEIKRRWGDNSGLGFLKGATIDAERVCVCVCMCERVRMHEPPVRLCTMDVCVEMRRSGGARPDWPNPEAAVAITGRVLHNAPGCSKWRGEDGGGGERTLRGEPGPVRPGPARPASLRAATARRGSAPSNLGLSQLEKNCACFRADWRVWDQLVIS